MRPVLYGIANCDSVKRARRWLADQSIDVVFHDFKKAGVPAERLPVWLDALGWQRLLNRKGTTWRALDTSEREGVRDAATASVLMTAHPSVIKRPVIEWDASTVTVGFDPGDWPAHAAAAARVD